MTAFRRLLAAAAAVLLAAPAAAQPSAGDWNVVSLTATPVDPAAMETMAPGWHVTTPASALLYAPENVAADSVSSVFFLFSSAPGTGFGLAFGGDAASGSPAHTAFVVGPDGRFRVTRGTGAAARELVPWTAHEAIVRHPGGEANVRQRLGAARDGGSVVLTVNGREVARLAEEAAGWRGFAGFHAEGAVNAHAATLVVDVRNLAPVPAAAPAGS